MIEYHALSVGRRQEASERTGSKQMWKFTKMHGCGNDYVYFDCTKTPLPNASEAAVFMSDRNTGIGGDGIILIKPSACADFYMEMYNLDGSQGRMCGNGIRCVGKFVYDKGLTDKTDITVETLSGVKKLHLAVKDGKVYEVTVDMHNRLTVGDGAVQSPGPAAQPWDRKGVWTGCRIVLEPRYLCSNLFPLTY